MNLEEAMKVIEEILRRGNDAVIRKNGDSYIILEDKRTIRYST